MTHLLEGHELGRVSGTNTGTTVLSGLVSDGELAKIITNHLGLKDKESKNGCV